MHPIISVKFGRPQVPKWERCSKANPRSRHRPHVRMRRVNIWPYAETQNNNNMENIGRDQKICIFFRRQDHKKKGIFVQRQGRKIYVYFSDQGTQQICIFFDVRIFRGGLLFPMKSLFFRLHQKIWKTITNKYLYFWKIQQKYLYFLSAPSRKICIFFSIFAHGVARSLLHDQRNSKTLWPHFLDAPATNDYNVTNSPSPRGVWLGGRVGRQLCPSRGGSSKWEVRLRRGRPHGRRAVCGGGQRVVILTSAQIFTDEILFKKKKRYVYK